MSNRVLLGLALALGVLSASAFGQAAADYALTHSGSAASSTSLGSQFNSTLEDSLNRLSRRIQPRSMIVPQVPQYQSRGKWTFSYVTTAASLPLRGPLRAAAAPAPFSDSKGSPFPISVQGGEIPCAGTPVTGRAQTQQAKTVPESVYMYCRSNNSSAQDRNLHPTMITLSSAK